MKRSTLNILLLTLSLAPAAGHAGERHFARPGDNLLVDYTCYLADNSLVETTLAYVAGDPSIAKSSMFQLRKSYGPEKFQVTATPDTIKDKPFDPLEQKIGNAIARNGSQIVVDDTARMELHSTETENFSTRERYLRMALSYPLPRSKKFPREQFHEYYKDAPLKIGTRVGEDSDFPGIIQQVTEDSIEVYYSVSPGAVIHHPWGPAKVHEVSESMFEGRMDIHPGMLLPRVGGLPGVVTEIGPEQFTIDYGQSFAGQTLYCDVKAIRNDPASPPQKRQIPWNENLDKALTQAAGAGKPVVLFLYDDTCGNCNQMLNSVFADSSVSRYSDDFVWSKINSGKERRIADRFSPKSYPTTLILHPDGSTLDKLEGYRDITTMAYSLNTAKSRKLLP